MSLNALRAQLNVPLDESGRPRGLEDGPRPPPTADKSAPLPTSSASPAPRSRTVQLTVLFCGVCLAIAIMFAVSGTDQRVFSLPGAWPSSRPGASPGAGADDDDPLFQPF